MIELDLTSQTVSDMDTSSLNVMPKSDVFSRTFILDEHIHKRLSTLSKCILQNVSRSKEQKLISSKGDWMFGGGVECAYTAAWPNAANRVCSANPISKFAYKTNHKSFK